MIRDYSKYKPFRFWCQKVLPLVYDDSLSYYELLNKVVDYLNNVIKDANALGTAFEELDAMVNDYFDNLDVQEEINAKLDSMAEDGTLDAMILPLVGDAVSDWLEDNVTPTGSAVMVDASLTISGAAADAKKTGDEISDLKSEINESDNDVYSLIHNDIIAIGEESDFARGTVLAGNYNSSIHYRVSTPNNLKIGIPITLSIAKGYRYNLYFFVNGTYSSSSDWQSGEYTIPANSEFKIVIARTSENASETANIHEFVSALKYTQPFYEVLNKAVYENEVDNNPSYDLPITAFDRGQISSMNGQLSDLSYRVRTTHIQKLSKPINIFVHKGFRLNVFYYKESSNLPYGTLDSSVQGIVGDFTIPANTYFRVLIYRVTENSSETANIEEFYNAIAFESIKRDLSDELDSLFNRFGKVISNSIYQHSECDVYTVKVKPSSINALLKIEKSEANNSGDYRTIGYVDFANNKIGFYKGVSDSGTLTEQVSRVVPFSFVANHEYFVSLYKVHNEYAILKITDGYSLDSFSLTTYQYLVGRGWGKGKYEFTVSGASATALSETTQILQNVNPRVLIIGDSFVEGSSIIASGEDYNARFASLIKDALNGDCYISGRGGYGAYNIWEEMDSYIFDIVSPKYVIICAGTNDSNYSMWKGRMNAMITIIESHNAIPILMTVAPNASVSASVFANMNSYIRNSGKHYIEVAIPFSTGYDGTTPNNTLKLSDQLHPNVEGNRIIFERAKLDVPFLFD